MPLGKKPSKEKEYLVTNREQQVDGLPADGSNSEEPAALTQLSSEGIGPGKIPPRKLSFQAQRATFLKAGRLMSQHYSRTGITERSRST